MAYAPAGNMTTDAGKTHLATVYYKRVALDNLYQNFYFMDGTEPDEIPLRNGPTVQWYRYTLPGATTTPSSEGTVGTSLTSPSTTVSATVSQYSDFYSISTFLEETAIDPVVENHVKLLSYRFAKSVDTILRTEFDSTTTPELNTIGATFTAADIRRGNALLRGVDLRKGPRGRSENLCIAHPYVIYDLKADNTAGGFIDILKYARPTQFANGEVGMIDGTAIVETTNVKTSGTAPNVLYHTYQIGGGAVGAVELAGRGPSKVRDPEKQTFRVNVVKGGPNTADPEGNIGSFVSGRYVMVAKILDSTNYRYRVHKADASLV